MILGWIKILCDVDHHQTQWITCKVKIGLVFSFPTQKKKPSHFRFPSTMVHINVCLSLSGFYIPYQVALLTLLLRTSHFTLFSGFVLVCEKKKLIVAILAHNISMIQCTPSYQQMVIIIILIQYP